MGKRGPKPRGYVAPAQPEAPKIEEESEASPLILYHRNGGGYLECKTQEEYDRELARGKWQASP